MKIHQYGSCALDGKLSCSEACARETTIRENILQQPLEVGGALSAGVLEDVLAARGEEDIGHVELLDVNDPKFKYLLAGVWQNAMADEVWSRVQAAVERWEWKPTRIPKSVAHAARFCCYT